MIKRLLVVLASATMLAACSTVAGGQRTASSRTGDQASAGWRSPARVETKLPYSTASPHTVQQMPSPGSCRYRGSGLFAEPDPRCTPGALDPAVTQATIGRTICGAGGYAHSVRPPERITDTEKRAEMAAYSNPARLSTIELDHDVPISLGGAVNDPRNYWAEPDYPKISPDAIFRNPKDRLELVEHDLVCEHRVSLTVARAQIATNWAAAYRRYLR